jgi:hypothetical protein
MRFSTLCALLAALLLAVPLCAQFDVGTITGRVTDQTGAVVPGVQITVTQTEMNFEAKAETNADGLYRAEQLRPGPYRLNFAAQGFKKIVRENVELHASETLAINVSLEVGALTDSVEVTANPEMLDTDTAAIGTRVEGDYFYRLPNFQRNIKSSLFYTPGLTYNGQAYTGDMNWAHLDGLLPQDIGMFEDGALATVGDGMTSDTIENTIQEIKVLTSVLPAEYGHSPGGAISVVKKSGTNEVHGLASEYGRVRSMQERKFFDQYTNAQIQPGWLHAPGLLSENPDGMISGPVFIPHIYDGRNKTFFTFAIQRYIEKQSKEAYSTVPTPAEIGGDFTFGGIGQPIYDPSSTYEDSSGNWHRNQFPNNIIPTSQIDKVAAKFMAMGPFLSPNAPGSLLATGPSNNFFSAPMKLVFWENYSVRLDHQFTPNLKAYATVTYNSRFQRQPPYTIPVDSIFDPTNNPTGGGTNNYQTTWSAGTTWVPTPTLVNDLRASYYRYNNPADSTAFDKNYAQLLGITGGSNGFGTAGLPATCMPQIWPGGFSESPQMGCPNQNLQEIITLKDDLSKAWGAHAFKFGYELLRYRQDTYGYGNPDGSYSYQGTSGLNPNGTNPSNTGNTFAGFLTGEISGDSFSTTLHSNLPRVWQNSWYAQDDWKILPSLTLNIGLRYNIETPVQDKYGLISEFNPTAQSNETWTNYTCVYPQCQGAWTHPYGAAPYNTQYNRWDPRVGLAWHPGNRYVIRAGAAINHVDMKFNEYQTNELTSESYSLSEPNGSHIPLFQLQNGIPTFNYPAARADGSIPFVGNAGATSGNMVDPNIHDPYTMNWNFTVETQLSRDYMLTLQYQGSAEAQQLGSWNINTMPFGMIPNYNGGGFINLGDPSEAAFRSSWLNNTQPSLWWNNLGSLTYTGNDGHRGHHEGTVKIEKRYSSGLNFLAFLTYAKTISRGSTGNPYQSWWLTKGITNSSIPLVFTGTMTYELPVGKGRKFMNTGGWKDKVFGGWDFVWTYTISSGGAENLGMSGGTYQSSNYQYPGYMPNYGNVLLLVDPKLRSNWQDLGANRFNSNWENSVWQCGFDNSWVAQWGNSCMVEKQPFSLGNDGTDVAYVERIIAATASLGKIVPLKERLKLQLRLDYQNPFKWYNWGPPGASVNIAASASSIFNKGFGVAGGDAVTSTYGGDPLMNATIALKF